MYYIFCRRNNQADRLLLPIRHSECSAISWRKAGLCSDGRLIGLGEEGQAGVDEASRVTIAGA